MLSKYRTAIECLPMPVDNVLRHHLELPARRSLYSSLQARGLCQADVLFTLLPFRSEPVFEEAIQSILGRPIETCPPAVPPRVPAPVRARPRGPDDRRVTRVGPNPRLPTTPAFQRYRKIRVGLSVAQLLSRGVTRKDMRQMVPTHVELEVLP